MITHRNKNQIVSLIEHSDYIAVLGSLLIGFTLAWSIWQPGFHTKPDFTMRDGNEQLLTRSLPTPETTHSVAPELTKEVVKEEQYAAIDEPTPPAVFDPSQRLPELFLKSKPTNDGYLIYFTTNDFTIGHDGSIVLYQDDQPVTKLFGSPHYLSKTFIEQSTNISVGLVDGAGNGVNEKEYIRFE